MTTTDTKRLKMLSDILPTGISEEVCELPSIAKAMLLMETADDLLEKLEGFPQLMLSATTTQWVKSLDMRSQLRLIEDLAFMLMSEIKQ